MQTVLNKLKQTGGVIESNTVMHQITADEMVERQRLTIESLHRELERQHSRADFFKALFIGMWLLVALLLFALYVLKTQR